MAHSMEGSLQAAFGVLDGARQASWHFSISKAGQVYQHVDTDNIAWTNGSYDANKLFWGIECEGVAGEPVTDPQFDALLDVLRWLWATHGVAAPEREETLWEHNQMTRFGSAATACPSGRIPWARLINEWEDDMGMTDEEKVAFNELIGRVADLESLPIVRRFVIEGGDGAQYLYLGGFEAWHIPNTAALTASGLNRINLETWKRSDAQLKGVTLLRAS